MKILFVITGLGVGGAERQVLDIADGLSRRGHIIKIAYLTGNAQLFPEKKDIEIIPLKVTKTVFGFTRGLYRLTRTVRDFQPDVIHSHMVHANLLSRIARLFVNMKRLICTAHSTNEGGRLRMFAYRLTDKMADISTNVSKEAVHAFEKMGAAPKGKMLPVLNGINFEKFRFLSTAREYHRKILKYPNIKVILAVGRLYEEKDYPNLLRAFSKLVNDRHAVCLWIVGDGPLRVKLEVLVDELGLNDNVIFFGIRNDIQEIMSASDVFVLSSSHEGFGLVVAEAMATERVVVATDCGGVRELVADCGYLVSPGDDMKLAEALNNAIMLSRESSAQLGYLARQRIVTHFGLEAVISKWLLIYKTTDNN